VAVSHIYHHRASVQFIRPPHSIFRENRANEEKCKPETPDHDERAHEKIFDFFAGNFFLLWYFFSHKERNPLLISVSFLIGQRSSGNQSNSRFTSAVRDDTKVAARPSFHGQQKSLNPNLSARDALLERE
jgi:hypothetical protein